MFVVLGVPVPMLDALLVVLLALCFFLVLWEEAGVLGVVSLAGAFPIDLVAESPIGPLAGAVDDLAVELPMDEPLEEPVPDVCAMANGDPIKQPETTPAKINLDVFIFSSFFEQVLYGWVGGIWGCNLKHADGIGFQLRASVGLILTAM